MINPKKRLYALLLSDNFNPKFLIHDTDKTNNIQL